MLENIILSLGFYTATAIFTGYSIQFNFTMDLLKNTVYIKVSWKFYIFTWNISCHLVTTTCVFWVVTHTWIVTGISERLRRIRFNITVSAFSLWEVYKIQLFWKGLFFFKGAFKINYVNPPYPTCSNN